MKNLLLITTLAALLAGACGSDDGGGDSALRDAIAESILDDSRDSGPSEDEAKCIADAALDTLGTDRLVDLGVTVEAVEEGMEFPEDELSDEETEAYVNASLDCVDTSSLIVDEMVADGVSEEDAKCIAENLDEDLFAKFATAGSPDEDPELMGAMIDVMSECNVTDFG